MRCRMELTHLWLQSVVTKCYSTVCVFMSLSCRVMSLCCVFVYVFRLLSIITVGTLVVYLLYSNGNRQKSVVMATLIICPIAVAYSMGQIIKSVRVCLSVCQHAHGRIFLSIFAKIGTDVRTPKSKNEFVGGQYRTTPSPILPPKRPVLG